MSYITEPKDPIRRLYAVVEEKNGNHGILAELVEGRWFPLVTSNKDLLHEMRLVAKRMGERHNKKILIMTFERSEVETIHSPVPEENAGASPA